MATAAHPTNQHYDADPAMFELFLDASLKYSSGLFESPDDDLDRAQANKRRFVADLLGLGGGERVLDIGAGWGSVTVPFARDWGCHVTAVTPSGRQAEHIRRLAAEAGVADRVDVRHGTIEELAFEPRSYDAVTMLGSIVHMPDRVGVLRTAHRALRTDGRIYVSESCFRNRERYEAFVEAPGSVFLRDDIFGNGDMVPASVYVAALEDAGFSLRALHDLTEDYRQTITHWIANATRNRDALDALEPGLADRLVRYFETANAGWGYTIKHYALVGVRRR